MAHMGSVANRGWRKFFLLMTTAWTAGGVLLFVLAPLTGLALLTLAVISPLAWHWAAERRLPWHNPTPVFVAFYLAAAYLALNATWSLSPAWGLFAAGMLLAYVGAVDVALGAFQDAEGDVLHAMALGFVVGITLGGAYIGFEVLSGQWLRRQLMPVLPWLQPVEAKDIMIGADGRELPKPHLLNRSITVLALMFWPAVLVGLQLGNTRPLRRRLLFLSLAPVALAVMGSVHATSKLALLGSSIIFSIARVRRALAYRLMLSAWLAATLLVVPLAMTLFALRLDTLPWLFPSAQERIVIWGYTSQQVMKAPLLGVGINSARVLHQKERAHAPRAEGSPFKLTTGVHSHSGYLQTWYEAGAVGAAFLLSLGLLILRALMHATPGTQPYLLATFASCALVGALSFSLWQPWFIASFGFAALFAGLGLKRLEEQ